MVRHDGDAPGEKVGQITELAPAGERLQGRGLAQRKSGGLRQLLGLDERADGEHEDGRPRQERDVFRLWPSGEFPPGWRKRVHCARTSLKWPA